MCITERKASPVIECQLLSNKQIIRYTDECKERFIYIHSWLKLELYWRRGKVVLNVALYGNITLTPFFFLFRLAAKQLYHTHTRTHTHTHSHTHTHTLTHTHTHRSSRQKFNPFWHALHHLWQMYLHLKTIFYSFKRLSHASKTSLSCLVTRYLGRFLPLRLKNLFCFFFLFTVFILLLRLLILFIRFSFFFPFICYSLH